MPNKGYKPTLAQLRSFVTVAEYKHFGTAASKLGISQPSLSQGLVALENGLGIKLIERSTRRVIVTPQGESLLPHARAALDAADAFVATSRGERGTLEGTITIGIIPTIAPYLLPHLLAELAQTYPNCEPRIVEQQTAHLTTELREGHIDVAIMALPVDAQGLSDIELYTEPFVAVAPEGRLHSAGRTLTLEDLGTMELLLLDDGHCLRDQVVDLCKRGDAHAKPTSMTVSRASSLTTVVQLVVAGHGSTLLPLSAVTTECSRPGLDRFEFDPEVGAGRTIGLVYRASAAQSEEFAALGELVRAAYTRATVQAEAAGLHS